MKIFKLLVSAVSIMALSIMFIGCGVHIIEEKKYERKGKEIAQNYIKDKYGFEGNITHVGIQEANGSILDNSPPPTGEVYVYMEYNGVDFTVYTDVKNNNGECYDNYQMSEIEKDIISKISKCAGKEPIDYQFCYGKLISMDSDHNGVVDLYYDGSNLDEILNSDKVNVLGIFKFVGMDDFDNLNNFRFSNKSSERLLFLNYRDNESIEKVEDNNYGLLANWGDDYIAGNIYDNAIYVKNARLMRNDSNIDYFNNVKESNGVYYFKPESNDDIHFSIKKAEDISNWNGKGILPGRGKIITPAYGVEKQVQNIISDNDLKNQKNLHIFYPAEKLDKDKKYRVGIRYNNGDKETFTTDIGNFIGDYYHFTISEYNEDQSFTIIEADD